MRRFSRKRSGSPTDFWPRSSRRNPLAILLALIIGGAIMWGRSGSPKPFGTDHDRYHDKVIKCIHVVDGDTLDLDAPDGMKASTRVRLWGVDTPETVKPGEPPMYYGQEASDYAKSRATNQSVRIVLAPENTRDRYGRLLAYVYLPDNTMLNEDLIERGLAYADTRFPHAWKERFVLLEQRARKNKVGLWAGVRVDQMPPWRQRIEHHRAEPRPSSKQSHTRG